MTIKKLRHEIDLIDTKLIDLLNRRAELARQVGEVKKQRGQPIFDPARQRRILQRLLRHGSGPLPREGLVRIFTEILSACLSLEQKIRVGYLGPEATFSHLAALREFGHSVKLVPYLSIPDIFIAVSGNQIEYGVVPIENSTEGIVHYTMDQFLESDLKICSELMLRVHHNLLSNVPLPQIKKIYSHPQPFRQCHNWIKEHLPQAKLIEVGSSARGAELAAKAKDAAAIGSEVAAEKYGLRIQARSIEDKPGNVTRFLVIGHRHPGPSGNDKTSIMFTLRDKPGALVDALMPLQRARINMTNIDVRPSRRKAWDYVFFVDMEGHIEGSKIARALEKMSKHCVLLKVLGSYPKQTAELR